jgi:hypothetical protein
MKCPKCKAGNHKPYCWNCGFKISDDYFKCVGCGEKYLEEFCSATNNRMCQWCGGDLE